MKQPGTVVPPAPPPRLSALFDVAPLDEGELLTEPALAAKRTIKFAVHAPEGEVSIRGWRVTESHIIVFGKTK